MDTPSDLPRRLASAYYAVRLPWPDLRLADYEKLLTELGRITPGTGGDASDAAEPAERLAEFVRVMREDQRGFFSHLEDLTDDHGGNGALIHHHRDRSCVAEVRERWESTCARAANSHERIEEECARPAARLLRRAGIVPVVPDYLAGTSPAWITGRPDPGSRPDHTAGRAAAAEALLRWRQDRYGPRVFVVTGSSGSGKTHLLSWFTESTILGWSDDSNRKEDRAVASLGGMDVEECARHLSAQLGLDAKDLGALVATPRPVTVTLAELHRSSDPERLVSELIRPLAANPNVDLVVEARDVETLGLETLGPGTEPYVLDLDDPRCTDFELFSPWYAGEAAHLPGLSPFTAGQVHPSPGIAVIAARARGADPGPAFPLAERVARAWLDGLSAPARDAAATLALALAPMGLATWRMLHCGRHPHDAETAFRGIDEAAAHLPTAEPGIPVYVLRLRALVEAVAPLPGARSVAHRELAAIMRGWSVSGCQEPPHYVRGHLGGHLRLAGALAPEDVAPLPLTPPQVRLTRAMLEEVFGPDGVLRLTPEQIHPAITHPATRRFLTEVGLPRGGVFESDGTEDSPRLHTPMTQQWDEESLRGLRACPGLPEDLHSVFMLDFLQYWYLLLDGRTGLVHEVFESMEQAHVAHRDVESYAYFVYAIHRDHALWRGRREHPEVSYWSGDNLVLELNTYEPHAMAGPEQAWQILLDELSADMWQVKDAPYE